jgi:hypothetical protein
LRSMLAHTSSLMLKFPYPLFDYFQVFGDDS